MMEGGGLFGVVRRPRGADLPGDGAMLLAVGRETRCIPAMIRRVLRYRDGVRRIGLSRRWRVMERMYSGVTATIPVQRAVVPPAVRWRWLRRAVVWQCGRG